MISSRSKQAAHNNAIWCDTICRAHDIPGEFHDSLWLNRRPVPRFYSNAVTLNIDAVSKQLAHIRNLIGTLGTFSVKDSFCALDLAPFGFQLLFAATWLWREASRPQPTAVLEGIRWTAVQDPTELANWESAWNKLLNGDHSTSPPRTFLPSLLSNKEFAFIAAYQGQEIVAGAAANQTGNVVGISNVFTPEENALPYWAGCVTAIMEAFPRLPLVGYERGEELTIARQLGFEALRPLRVWVR